VREYTNPLQSSIDDVLTRIDRLNAKILGWPSLEGLASQETTSDRTSLSYIPNTSSVKSLPLLDAEFVTNWTYAFGDEKLSTKSVFEDKRGLGSTLCLGDDKEIKMDGTSIKLLIALLESPNNQVSYSDLIQMNFFLKSPKMPEVSYKRARARMAKDASQLRQTLNAWGLCWSISSRTSDNEVYIQLKTNRSAPSPHSS
jgi:hypothetical protein